MQLTVADTPPTPPEPLLAPGEGGEWSGPRAKVGEKSRSPGPNVFRVTPDAVHSAPFPQSGPYSAVTDPPPYADGGTRSRDKT